MTTETEIRGKAFVHCQAWKEAYAGLIDQAYLDSRTYEMSERAAFRAHENGIPTWIAVDEDRVVGFVDFGPCRNPDLPRAGEIYAIYILKKYYGQGVGALLMQKALEALASYDQVAVWALRENHRALRFYQKFGFRPDGNEETLTLGTDVIEVRLLRSQK